MSKFKMIAVDLDGTLLTNDKRISAVNEQAIHDAMNAGIKVCLCTGRAWPGCRQFAKQLNTNCLVITSNGAMIMEPDFQGGSLNANIFYNETLSEADAMNIYAQGNAWNASQIVWYNNTLYGNRIDERLLDYGNRYGKMEPTLCSDFETKAKNGISKILWYSDPETIMTWRGMGAHELSPNVTVCTSEPDFLEFFSNRVSKAKAIKLVADKYNIDLSEIVAVGDGTNDLPILEAVGLGVAMGNASDEIKKVCGHVTLTNEEDGVACLIHDILRGENLL